MLEPIEAFIDADPAGYAALRAAVPLFQLCAGLIAADRRKAFVAVGPAAERVAADQRHDRAYR
jgi:hypothetical protein